MEIKNAEVFDFYKNHTFIDFEKANIFLMDLFKNCIDYTKIPSVQKIDLPFSFSSTDTMNKETQPNCSLPNYTISKQLSGLISEEKIELILNKINPSDTITQNTDETIFCDFIITKTNQPNILIQNKSTESNVKKGEIDNFIQSCKKTKSNGILMSQNTGIAEKQNFEIDIIDTNVILYIHCVNHDEKTIALAFEIIDKVYNKIKGINPDNIITISKEQLYEINNEYQLFTSQKEEIQKYVKEYNSNLLNQLDKNIKLTNLNNYLSSKIIQTEKVGIHKCCICHLYTSNTLKGMAAHKRGCKRKHLQNNHVSSIKTTQTK